MPCSQMPRLRASFGSSSVSGLRLLQEGCLICSEAERNTACTKYQSSSIRVLSISSEHWRQVPVHDAEVPSYFLPPLRLGLRLGSEIRTRAPETRSTASLQQATAAASSGRRELLLSEAAYPEAHKRYQPHGVRSRGSLAQTGFDSSRKRAVA